MKRASEFDYLLPFQRYRIFFSRKKFIFENFSVKIEWVSENGVFFRVLFFSALWKWLCEGSVNFSRKKNLKKEKKKKHLQNVKHCFLDLSFTFFWRNPFFWQVSSLPTFHIKQISIFFLELEKNKIIRHFVNEWEINFSGKKYDTFTITPNNPWPLVPNPKPLASYLVLFYLKIFWGKNPKGEGGGKTYKMGVGGWLTYKNNGSFGGGEHIIILLLLFQITHFL